MTHYDNDHSPNRYEIPKGRLFILAFLMLLTSCGITGKPKKEVEPSYPVQLFMDADTTPYDRGLAKISDSPDSIQILNPDEFDNPFSSEYLRMIQNGVLQIEHLNKQTGDYYTCSGFVAQNSGDGHTYVITSNHCSELNDQTGTTITNLGTGDQLDLTTEQLEVFDNHNPYGDSYRILRFAQSDNNEILDKWNPLPINNSNFTGTQVLTIGHPFQLDTQEAGQQHKAVGVLSEIVCDLGPDAPYMMRSVDSEWLEGGLSGAGVFSFNEHGIPAVVGIHQGTQTLQKINNPKCDSIINTPSADITTFQGLPSDLGIFFN